MSPTLSGSDSPLPGRWAPQIGEALAGSYLLVVGWVVGVVGVVLLVRRRVDGIYLAAFAGGLIALNGGVADLADVSRSQLLFAGPPNVARAAVAVSLGLGGGLVAAAVLRPLRQSYGLPTADSSAALGELRAVVSQAAAVTATKPSELRTSIEALAEAIRHLLAAGGLPEIDPSMAASCRHAMRANRVRAYGVAPSTALHVTLAPESPASGRTAPHRIAVEALRENTGGVGTR